jgi:hypothetical protein
VAADRIEDHSQYEYFVDGAWTKARPSIGQKGISIENASAGGQGTYYYSEHWSSFVWIGGNSIPGANFFITTAPRPEGPWREPCLFYKGVSGNYSLSAYSIQAHPAMTKNIPRNGIFVTYTKTDVIAPDTNRYTTPLVYVQWER